MLKKNIFKSVFVIFFLIFILTVIMPEKQIEFGKFPALKIEEEKVFKLLQKLNKDIEITAVPADCASPKWTILIHFALDNNLSGNMKLLNNFEVLESIEAKDKNDNLEIAVLVDGLNGKPYEDGYYHITGRDFKDDLVIPADEINSGAIEEVEAFIDWAVNNYPGDRYYYSLLNHGNGFEDTSLTGTELSEKELRGEEKELSDSSTMLWAGSDVTNHDVLTHYEFGKIFEYFNLKINKKIEIFYLSACRMGGIELAYELKDYVNYLLASQVAIGGNTWSYEPLELLINDPAISAMQLGIEYCKSGHDFYSNVGEGEVSAYTLTLTYLPAIGYLKLFLDYYADMAIQSIQRDVKKADYFDLSANLSGDNVVFTDIGNYLKEIQLSPDMDFEVRIQAYLTKIIYDFAIQYHIEVNNPDKTGLTIFHNHWLIEDQYSIELYKNLLKFGKESRWVSFLELMESLAVKKDEYEPDNNFDSAIGLSLSEIKQVHTIYPIRDKDFLVLDLYNLEDNMHIKIETYPINQIRYTPMIITLYDQDKKVICSDLNSIIFKPKYAGKYYIQIKSDGDKMGEYAIDAIICGAPEGDEYESDDDFDTGNFLTDPDAVIQKHTLHINGDEDFIKIEYTQAFPEEFSMLARVISSYPYKISLYDEFYNLLSEGQYIFDSDSLLSYISVNLYPITKPGIYYLKIAQDISYNNCLRAKGTYSLEIIKRKPDIYESNNSPELAKEYYINSGQSMLQFHNTNDEDWLFFTALSNDVVAIKLQAERNDYNNLLFCFIYHESDLEHEIGFLLNTAGEEFQCPLDGKYYIKIISPELSFFCFENYFFEIIR